jgi:hypothetical protein
LQLPLSFIIPLSASFLHQASSELPPSASCRSQHLADFVYLHPLSFFNLTQLEALSSLSQLLQIISSFSQLQLKPLPHPLFIYLLRTPQLFSSIQHLDDSSILLQSLHHHLLSSSESYLEHISVYESFLEPSASRSCLSMSMLPSNLLY